MFIEVTPENKEELKEEPPEAKGSFEPFSACSQGFLVY
jgi:hypothetical protein